MSLPVPEPLPRELSVGGFARRAGGLVLVGLVVALLIGTLPGLDEVRERFANAEPAWLVALFFLEVASCLSYVVAFRGAFRTRLGWRFSYEIGMTEQGTNVLVPAGGVGVGSSAPPGCCGRGSPTRCSAPSATWRSTSSPWRPPSRPSAAPRPSPPSSSPT